jgi:cellulase
LPQGKNFGSIAFPSKSDFFFQSGKPGAKVAPVAAGGSIKLQWDTWPSSHHGPVIDYLARCAGDDCTSESAGDLSFFKIDEKGLNDAATQSWASDDLIADGNAWTVTVPKDIAPGQYVLRHEIIALHSAQDANGAQSYPQCISIEVTGSGTAEPEAVAATKLYTPTDPGISLSIYNDLTSYEIPGPAVYSGGASGSAPSSSAASSAAATTEASAASSATVVSSSAPFSNSSSATATSESAPEHTAEPTFAGEAESTPCTTTITLTGSSAATATATQTSSPVNTSDNSDDNSEDNSSSSSSDNTPTTTSAPVAVISAVASSLPSSVLNAPIPTETSSTDSDDGKPSKPLPAGFTLADLLEWVNYLLKKAMSTDSKHARDVVRR